jgi:pyruvate carboxylase
MSPTGGRSLRVRVASGDDEPALVVGPAPRASGRALLVDGRRVPAVIEVVEEGRAIVSIGARRPGRTTVVFGSRVFAAPSDGIERLEIVIDGWRFELDVEDERRASLRERASRAGAAAAGSGPAEVRAVIPGRVVAVSVAPGEVVGLGQHILVIEAMKMQNELRSPRAGTAGRVAVVPGQRVEVGDLLLVIE